MVRLASRTICRFLKLFVRWRMLSVLIICNKSGPGRSIRLWRYNDFDPSLVAGLIVIAMNFANIPGALVTIVQMAFMPEAGLGILATVGPSRQVECSEIRSLCPDHGWN